MITQDYLKEYLNYDPETGIFKWIKVKFKSQINLGQVAGFITSQGYRIIRMKSRNYLAHRLAWLYMTGEWPENYIDHINHIKDDNRFINLRKATNQENQFNAKLSIKNKSGYKGVCFHKRHNVFIAQAAYNKKTHFLGYYNSADMAYQAYLLFTKSKHGEFFNDSVSCK